MAKTSVHLDLWGEPIEDRPAPGTEIVPLDFETHAIRMVVLRGIPWWVLADVARALAYRDASDAARRLPSKTLHTHFLCTSAGEREMLLVNEPGVYRLILRSNKPEAERFQDWLTEEVLPSIRKTGSYSLPRKDDRIARTARRLKSDRVTAKLRCDSVDINKRLADRIAEDGGCVNDYKAFHNAVYRGQFGRTAAELREALGLRGSKHHTPLDHMSALTLAQNNHAKELAARSVAALEAELGGELSLPDQAAVFEGVARTIASNDRKELGSDYRFGVASDPRRGRVLDLVPAPLAATP